MTTIITIVEIITQMLLYFYFILTFSLAFLMNIVHEIDLKSFESAWYNNRLMSKVKNTNFINILRYVNLLSLTNLLKTTVEGVLIEGQYWNIYVQLILVWHFIYFPKANTFLLIGNVLNFSPAGFLDFAPQPLKIKSWLKTLKCHFFKLYNIKGRF